MVVTRGDAARFRVPRECSHERLQVAGWHQGIGIQTDDEIVGVGFRTDGIHQLFPGVSDSASLGRPASSAGRAIYDSEIEARDFAKQSEAGLVRLANRTSIGGELPGLRLVDTEPRDEAHAVLSPQRVNTAGEVVDLVLHRDGHVDGRPGKGERHQEDGGASEKEQDQVLDPQAARSYHQGSPEQLHGGPIDLPKSESVEEVDDDRDGDPEHTPEGIQELHSRHLFPESRLMTRPLVTTAQ